MFAGTGTTWRNRTEPRAGAGQGLLNSPPSPRWLPRRLQANPRHLFFCWRKEPSLSWLSLRFWELPHSSLPNLTMILQGGHSPAFFFAAGEGRDHHENCSDCVGEAFASLLWC